MYKEIQSSFAPLAISTVGPAVTRDYRSAEALRAFNRARRLSRLRKMASFRRTAKVGALLPDRQTRTRLLPKESCLEGIPISCIVDTVTVSGELMASKLRPRRRRCRPRATRAAAATGRHGGDGPRPGAARRSGRPAVSLLRLLCRLKTLLTVRGQS